MTAAEDNPRVCLLTDSFYPVVGGGETHALLLCREFLRRGIRVFVVTRRITPEMRSAETVEGLPIRRLPPSGFLRFGKYLMLAPTLLELVRRRRSYDLIYVCCFRVAGISAVLVSRLLKKPCVLRAESRGELSGGFIWDSPDPSIQRVRCRPLVRGYLKLRNRLLRGASAFLSISQEIHSEFRAAGVPDEKNHLIYNGIDAARFTPVTAARRAELRAALGLPAEAVIFAYSGKLNKGKGLEMLLRVWKPLAEAGRKGHLLLIGAGGGQFLSCETELRDYVRLHHLEDRVTITGFRSNVHEYLQSADCFVFPSENESFGLALLEAMACELPSLASRVGGIPEIIEDGKNGRLFDPHDERAWLDGMQGFLADPARYAGLGAAGRATVLQRFSIAQVVDQHLELFRSLTARGGMPR